METLEDLAADANRRYEDVVSSMRSALTSAAKAGAALIKARELVPYGEWSRWLAAKFRGSEETARNWMRIARGWDHLTYATGGDLESLRITDALRILRERKTPPPPRTTSREELISSVLAHLKGHLRAMSDEDIARLSAGFDVVIEKMLDVIDQRHEMENR